MSMGGKDVGEAAESVAEDGYASVEEVYPNLAILTFSNLLQIVIYNNILCVILIQVLKSDQDDDAMSMTSSQQRAWKVYKQIDYFVQTQSSFIELLKTNFYFRLLNRKIIQFICKVSDGLSVEKQKKHKTGRVLRTSMQLF